MNKTDFLKKWDNGEGFDWRAGCGCGWNSGDNDEIYNKEIEYGGGYEKLVADFRALDPHDQKTVAGMFMYDTVDKFFDAAKIDYKSFKLTFDPGDDNIFEKNDILVGGGYMAFIGELDILLLSQDLLAKTVIMARLSDEVEKELNDAGLNPVALFWKTYDNEKADKLLSAREIVYVAGGKRFVGELKSLPEAEAIKALDALQGVTNPIMLDELKVSFQEYGDEYNLAQFPNLNMEPYISLREGRKIITDSSGKIVSKIEPGTLPPPLYELPVNWEEAFYEAVYKRSRMSIKAVNINEFVSLFNKYKDEIPVATILKLKDAIVKEGNLHYDRAWFEIALRGVSRKERKDSRIDYKEVGEVELTSETGNFLKAVRGLKDVKLEEEVIEDPASHKRRKFYRILVPRVATSYEFEVRDKNNDAYAIIRPPLAPGAAGTFESTSLPLHISAFYQKYDINTSFMTIQERKFNDNELSTFFFNGGNLTVKVSSITGDVYLQPTGDFAEGFLETERIN